MSKSRIVTILILDAVVWAIAIWLIFIEPQQRSRPRFWLHYARFWRDVACVAGMEAIRAEHNYWKAIGRV